jgi:glycosyltransferase involved in cell wall biosynthesis
MSDGVRVIRALFPNYEIGRAAAHACASLIRGMDRPGWRAEYWMYHCAPGLESSRLRSLMPRSLLRAAFRVKVADSKLARLLEVRYLRNIGAGDVAYLWPGTSTGLYRELRQRRIPIVREQINTHAVTYRRCLQKAYEALSWPLPPRGIPTEAAIAREDEELGLADFVFAPSELVAASLVDSGVAKSKIIPASYGWSEIDVKRASIPAPAVHSSDRPVTFMFAAQGCVRKGLPWLLQAWKKANLSTAQLLLFGSIDRDVSQHCAGLLETSGVRMCGFVDDLRDWYSRADIFVLPSHEEGSPMVSYAAAAAGLAMIVSPMGGGGFLRPSVDAMVLDPFDVASWADAFQVMHSNAQTRKSFQEAARARALDFTWQQVAQRRSEALLHSLARPSLEYV